MEDPKFKPKCYFNHAEVMDSVMIERSSFSLFLHENLFNFFQDIEDVANVLDSYSLMDFVANSSSYNYAN